MINNNLGRSLKIAGALITMYDSREHLSREVAKEVRRHFPGHVYDVEIPRAVALAEAPSFAKPVVLYAPETIGAKAYERLAREVVAQEVGSWKTEVRGRKLEDGSPRTEDGRLKTEVVKVKVVSYDDKPEIKLVNSGPVIIYNHDHNNI
jgi:nitrogenase subunit NifH